MSTEDFDEILKRARDRLTPEEQRKLSEKLREAGIATNGGAEDTRTMLEALEELGIPGSITDGPGDLSTNPKHMEGFGKDDN